MTVLLVLPKTRSGKILRKTTGTLADGDRTEPPAAIGDVDALDVIRNAVRGHSRAKRSR